MDTFDDAKIERMHAMEQGMKSLMKTTIWLGVGWNATGQTEQSSCRTHKNKDYFGDVITSLTSHLKAIKWLAVWGWDACRRARYRDTHSDWIGSICGLHFLLLLSPSFPPSLTSTPSLCAQPLNTFVRTRVRSKSNHEPPLAMSLNLTKNDTLLRLASPPSFIHSSPQSLLGIYNDVTKTDNNTQ